MVMVSHLLASVDSTTTPVLLAVLAIILPSTVALFTPRGRKICLGKYERWQLARKAKDRASQGGSDIQVSGIFVHPGKKKAFCSFSLRKTASCTAIYCAAPTINVL